MNRYAILLGKEPTEQELEDSKKLKNLRSEAMKEEFKKIYGGQPHPQYPGPREPADQSVFFQEFQYGQRDPRPDVTEIIPARSLSAEQAHILAQGMSRLSREAGIAIIVNNQRIGQVQNWETTRTGRWSALDQEIPGGRAIQYPADLMIRMTATAPIQLMEEQRRILQASGLTALREHALGMLDNMDFSPLEQRNLENQGINGSV
jgi:hypothetical protein